MTTNHALRVAALRVLSDAINAEAKDARADAEPEFARMRTQDGVKSLTVMLPDGSEVGTIAIKAGPTQTSWDEEAVLAFARQAAPSEVTETVDPAVLEDPTVREFIREHRPDAVREQVQPAYLKRLAPDENGKVVDPGTGEMFTVAQVTKEQPTGKFAYTPSKDAVDKIVAAWLAGELGQIGGPLAAPTQVEEAAWPEPRPPRSDVAPEVDLPVFTPAPASGDLFDGPFGPFGNEQGGPF